MAKRFIVVGTLIALLIVAVCFMYFDRPTAYYFRYDDSWLKELARFATKFGYAAWYFAIMVIILIYYGYMKKNTRYFHRILFVATSAALAGTLNGVLKFVFGRYRPEALFSSSLYGFSWFSSEYFQTSFPSGHACFITSLMLAISLLFPAYGLICLPFAAVVAFSRVITCAHYLSDVLSGVLVAFWVTWCWKKQFVAIDFLQTRRYSETSGAGKPEESAKNVLR